MAHEPAARVHDVMVVTISCEGKLTQSLGGNEEVVPESVW